MSIYFFLRSFWRPYVIFVSLMTPLSAQNQAILMRHKNIMQKQRGRVTETAYAPKIQRFYFICRHKFFWDGIDERLNIRDWRSPTATLMQVAQPPFHSVSNVNSLYEVRLFKCCEETSGLRFDMGEGKHLARSCLHCFEHVHSVRSNQSAWLTWW